MMGQTITDYSKFVDDTNLGGVTDMPEGCHAIQRDIDRLDKWASRSLMKFSKENCKALHLGRNNPMHQYMLEDDHLESNLAENDLGVLMDNRLNVSQQWALAAKSNGILH